MTLDRRGFLGAVAGLVLLPRLPRRRVVLQIVEHEHGGGYTIVRMEGCHISRDHTIVIDP